MVKSMEHPVAPRAATATFIWNGAMLEALEHCLPSDRQLLEAFFGLVGRLNEFQRNDLLYAFGLNGERLTEPRSIFDVQRRMRSSTKEVAETNLDNIFTQLRQRYSWKVEFGRSWLAMAVSVAFRRMQTGRRGQDLPFERGGPPLPTREHGTTLLEDVIRRCREPTDRDRMSRLGEVLVSLAMRQQNVFVYWYSLDDDRLQPRRPGQTVERYRFKTEDVATEYVGGLWQILRANGLSADIDEAWLLDTLADIRSPGRRRRLAVVPFARPSPVPTPSTDGHPDVASCDMPGGSQPPPPAPPDEAPADPVEGSPEGTTQITEEEDDMAGSGVKKPVELTPSQFAALEACRKAASGSKPPDNLAVWAREKGYANQWADLRTMGIVKKNSDGTYAIAKAPVVLKERGKGAVASAKPAKGEPKADKPKRAKGDDDHRSDDAKELHAAIRFFEEHPELLDMDRQLFAEALEHLENAELQGWKLVKQKDGSIHLVEAK